MTLRSRSLWAHEARPTAGPYRFAPLPHTITVFWTLLLTMALLALGRALVEWRAHMPVTRWNPLSDPLLGDLMEYPATYQVLHREAFFNNASPDSLPRQMFSAVAYPPFAAAVLAPLYLIVSPVWGYLCMAALWLAVALWRARGMLQQNGFPSEVATLFPLSLLILSFPVARLVHQGNIELLVWGLSATATWAFLQGSNRTAAVLWGMAGAMKLYPALLLLLLLPRRKTGSFLAGVATAVGVTLLSLWWLGPTVPLAWRGSLHNVFGYQNLRASEWSLRELIANHSWFTWAKLLAEMLHIPTQTMLLPYVACGAVLLAYTLKRVWTMPVTNQLLALSVFMLAFPSVSYFHTLVHLYLPLLLLVALAMQAQCKNVPLRGLLATLLVFLPLLAPYTLLFCPQILLFCGLFQSVALLLLWVCTMEFPFPGNPLHFPLKLCLKTPITRA